MLKTITILATVLGSPLAACGIDTDCTLGDRSYRIALPETQATGAIVFAHGYRGSAAGTIRNGNLRRMANDLGLAFVALDAMEDDWILPNAPRGHTSNATEMTYLEAVVADLGAQHGIPTDRLMLSGFSAGGMLVWNAACTRPDLFAGFVPVSGTFWLTPPDTCSTPVASVIHMHGDADTVVPMEGRAIGPTRQGDVQEALDMFRNTGGFQDVGRYSMLDGRLVCDGWTNRDSARADLCMFEGGHSFSRTYLGAAWDMLIAFGSIPPA